MFRQDSRNNSRRGRGRVLFKEEEEKKKVSKMPGLIFKEVLLIDSNRLHMVTDGSLSATRRCSVCITQLLLNTCQLKTGKRCRYLDGKETD